MARSRPPAPPRGPQGPQGPDSPNAPRKRSSRFGKRSKTKNIKCSEAASAWQLAIRSGGSPGAEVYKTLAHCRAANKTAKAGLAAGTVAGAALANRAVTSRVDRSLATATSRKAELQARIRERAGRTISDADRQRANDIASRVSGNTNGPSAALKRLQGVRATRTRRTATPAATPSPLQALRANAADRQGHRALHERERRLAASALTTLRQRGPAGRLEAKNLRRTAYNAVERRSPTGPDWSHSDADRAYMRSNERRVGRQNLMAYEVEARATDSLRRVPPQMVGPKPPRIGLEAYRRSRDQRTAPGVAESRSAAARALSALRQAGPSGRAEARIFQRSAVYQTSGGVDRGRAYTDHIVMQRQARGVNFNERGTRAENKAYLIGRGTFNPTTTIAERRSAAAGELAGLRRLRNASFAATGQRGPGNYWRDAVSNIQVNNGLDRPANLRSTAGNQSTSGTNRPGAVSRSSGALRRAWRDNQADQDRAAAAAAAARQAAQQAAAVAARPQGVTIGAGSTYTPRQLASARRQAGTFGDYTTNSIQTATQRRQAVDKAANMGLQLQGRSTDQKFNHLASILGAPPEAARYIRVTANRDSITLENTHPNGGNHTRTIQIDPTDNRPMIYNNLYKPNARARAEGMATDHYNRQILAARAAGIQRIRVSGAGYGDGQPDTSGHNWTGYHAWVEFGFSGPVGSRAANVFRNAHPSLANFDSNSQFVDAIHHPDPAVQQAARTAWRSYGTGTSMISLEISDPKHPTMKAYQTNWKKRRNDDWARSNVSTNASRNGNYDIYN